MLVFYLWPLGNIIVTSVTDPQFGLQNFRRFLNTSYVVTATVRTFEVSAAVTAVNLIIGYVYAYLLVVTPRGVSSALLVAVLLPFWSNFLVRTYAWTVILRDTRIINRTLMSAGLISEPLPLIRSTLGTAIGMTHILLPVMILPIWASMLQSIQTCRKQPPPRSRPLHQLSQGFPSSDDAGSDRRLPLGLRDGSRLLHHSGPTWRAEGHDDQHGGRHGGAAPQLGLW
jgi:hypothetical protein